MNTLSEIDDVSVVEDSDSDFESLLISAVGKNQGKDLSDNINII